MDNRSPGFHFYPDKWQSHTRRLTDSAYRVYHELLCWMWQQADDQCSIEATYAAVSCAVALPLQYVEAAFADIQNAYAPLLRTENGRWISNGLRKEVDKQKVRKEQCVKAAYAHHKAADARKKAADASIEHNIPYPIPIPVTHKEHPPTPKGGTSGKKSKPFEETPKGDPEWFSEFWKEYPRKQNKLPAIKAWNKLPLTVELAQKIVDAVVLQSQTHKWAVEKIIPHASTWLNNHRWNDEVEQTEIPEAY